MGKKTEYKILSYLAFFAIFMIIWTILHFTFENLRNSYIGMISAGISSILAPRIRAYKTQNGKQIQLKWIF